MKNFPVRIRSSFSDRSSPLPSEVLRMAHHSILEVPGMTCHSILEVPGMTRRSILEVPGMTCHSILEVAGMSGPVLESIMCQIVECSFLHVNPRGSVFYLTERVHLRYQKVKMLIEKD
jgi:hypothetical protein